MSTLRDRSQAASRDALSRDALWQEHGFMLGPWVVGSIVGAVILLSALGRLLG